MITKELAKRLSQKLKEPEEQLQERLDTIGTLEELPLPKFKEGLSTTLDKQKLPTSINNESYDKTTTHIITHVDAKVTAKLFSQANEYEQEIIEEYRYSTITTEKDKLIALQKAATDEGILIVIPPHTTTENPISILSNYDTNGFCHLLIIAQTGSKATITRKINEQKQHEGKGLVCEAVEIIAEDDAHITYNECQGLSQETCWYSQKKGTAHPHSTINWYTHITGADLSKQEIITTLAGHDAETITLNTTDLNNNQHNDTSTITYHAAANTKSGMYAKAVIGGKARTIHKGLIDIGDEAKNAEGYQQEDVILTDEGAEADTIPQLEIKNSEVQCGHGSTIGNIDEEQLFYLRSRGVSEAEARTLITKGFLTSITNHTEDEAWKEHINHILTQQQGKQE